MSGAYISVWMTIVCLAAGIHWLNHSNWLIRFLSDASYWTYLVHLPVLFIIQYWTMGLNWPWPAKLAFSSAATLALCLLSYPLLVRGATGAATGRAGGIKHPLSLAGPASRHREPPGNPLVHHLLKDIQWHGTLQQQCFVKLPQVKTFP